MRAATASEVEPLTLNEARALIEYAMHRPNGTRWSAALALGLRQGEALGLRRLHVDLAAEHFRYGSSYNASACVMAVMIFEPTRGLAGRGRGLV